MTCPKCGREWHPWPLPHPGCAPKDWVNCIRTEEPRILGGVPTTPKLPDAVKPVLARVEEQVKLMREKLSDGV